MPKQTFFNLPEEKRGKILDVALTEFADRGYKQAGISRMVAAAGIAKGSFYQYFEDKDDLFCHIVATMIGQRKMQVYQEEKVRLAELNLTEFLRVAFHRTMAEVMEDPRVMRVGIDLLTLMHEPVYARLLEHYKEDLNTYFVPFIRHEIEQGEIDSRINPQLLNFMLISLGQYLSAVLMSGQAEISHQLIDRLVDDMDYIFTHGIYGKAGG